MVSAIVTGATGILGREIVQRLARDPAWERIFALSRQKKEDYGPGTDKVIQSTLDLTGDAASMAKQLKEQGVKAEYVFFTAYLAKDDEQAACDVNGAMLSNFLHALDQSGAESSLRRLILTTGAKQYGVHLGPPKNPMEESDARVEGDGRPPNFYYVQQDILKAASQNKAWDWVVTYPNDVIGVARGNFMNLATALGLYITITRELCQDLVFPGSEAFYSMFDSFTSSRLNADFNAWAALEPRCGNQAFNVVNGDVTSWQILWPRLAKRYGLTIPASQFAGSSTGDFESSEIKLPTRPPIADFAPQTGLRDRVEAGVVRQRIDLVKWSQRADVRAAWNRLAQRHGLEKEAFDQATWGFLGFVLGRNYNLVISMSKARKFGWMGYMDSAEALETCLDELEQEEILPTH